jgi:xyloglucan-specific exo-beta-1,4-glucanase
MLLLLFQLVRKIAQFLNLKKRLGARYFYRSFCAASIALLLVVFLQPVLITSCVSHLNAEPRVVKTEMATGWNNVAVGGGGYVTDIYLHPQQADLIYIRTDNGGFFRWNANTESWLALTDHFPPSKFNYYGGEALALDRKNSDIVYIAAGMYTIEPGTIFKSTDRGATWVQSNLNVPMGGNQEKRWTGNRLAVSPFDSNVLLFGSRDNGLWRSTDGGITWTQVTTLSAKPEGGIGILNVAFDPHVPNHVYISAYGDGIYQSTDAGISWSKIVGSPAQAMKLSVAQDRTLYVTSAASPGVSKYVNTVWQDITPKQEATSVFNGLSVHPKNPQEVLVSVGETDSGAATIYHSQNGGAIWAEKRAAIDNQVPWLPNDFFSDSASAIQFDPQVPNRAWLTDWFAVWRTDDINANPTVWTNYAKGHEQTVIFTLVSPPKGTSLLSGVADLDGFYHSSLDTYPAKRLGSGRPGDYFGDTYSMAYCAAQPERLVRVGGRSWNSTYGGATSQDGGLTWQPFPNFPPNRMPLRVAVSATDPDKFVVTISEGQPLQTSNGGMYWQKVLGLPNGVKGPWNWSQSLVADGVNGDRFYYYADGTVYRSDDGGLSFSPVNTSLPEEDWHSIKTLPGVEGEVWVSVDKQGLYRSSDGGKTFSKISQVERANLFAFGKPPDGSTIPTLYLYGTLANQGEGIFLSLDRGITWNDISEPNHPIANKPLVLEASKQQFGLVFVGTNGRGIYYQQVTPRSQKLRSGNE